ncbi:uncharacterized protein PRCAT00001204001 [Priceomyces carsonii]|uniref:uncharacterized protein n=1 Tax=Priceomyces carsonii TaxID=28549 RepID=UPI002EDAF7DA|nr:unnamed protein product [Priceomyces carsonii]
MYQLHVWGNNRKLSVISPECLASSWLLTMLSTVKLIEFEIVTSSNTNISDIGKLPVLLVNKEKYNGFAEITSWVVEEMGSSGSDEFTIIKNDTKRLIDKSLVSLIENHLERIHLYNLYICTENYENFTRKLFQNFFPFPMMYNQPLKFYHNAQLQVQLSGLSAGTSGFFSLSNADIIQSEYLDQEIYESDEDKTVALSALHEKHILAKSRQKAKLRESRSHLKCLNLIERSIGLLLQLSKQENEESQHGYIFESGKLQPSEILLYAYLYCLTFENLPDRFISKYIEIQFPEFSKFGTKIIARLNKLLYEKSILIRDPCEQEIPNLWNEVQYQCGYIKY